MRLLVVEHDIALAAMIRETLSALDRTIDVVHDGSDGEDLLGLYAYDLLILGVPLPTRTGFDICRLARALGYAFPILILSVSDSLAEKVQSFDAGADDFLAKPFEMEELKLRARALLRRSSMRRESVIQVGNLTLDPGTGRVRRGPHEIRLMPKEFALLELLMRNAGRIVTHSQILLGLWSTDAEQSAGALRTHIKGIRKALGDADSATIIETVHGRGYRLSLVGPQAEADDPPGRHCTRPCKLFALQGT